MKYTRWLTAGLVAAAACAVSVQAWAVEFEGFTDFESVCPSCEKPASDVVELTGGEKVRCTVVAANEDFWVVERYGEIRAIPDREVASTTYADEQPPSDLRSQAQIVLKNGSVLTGSIVDESDKPGHYQLKSSVGDVSFVVFKERAKALYRNGSESTIDRSE